MNRKVMNRIRKTSQRLNGFVTEESKKQQKEAEKQQKEAEKQSARSAVRKKSYDKLKVSKEQRYDKLKKLRTIGSGSKGSVNDDARRFLKGYNERSQLEVCGVCGTDEEPRNLRFCNEETFGSIQASDLPQYRQYLAGKLNQPWHIKYLECIDEEFNESGMLRRTRYICKWCWKSLKSKDTIVNQMVDAVVEEDDELIESVDAEMNIGCNNGTSFQGNNNHNMPDDSSDDEDKEEEEEGDAEPLFTEKQTAWKLPVKTYLRGLYPGMVPSELQILTLVEISMVSLYNPITRISMGRVSFYHGK